MGSPSTSSCVESYLSEFRALVNHAVSYADYKNQDLKDVLCLSNEKHWGHLCASMDVVGDSLEALSDFLQYGLHGPSDSSSLGAAYLRLYGVLNAAWLQRDALRELMTVFGYPGIGDFKRAMRMHRLIQARNMVGAHGPRCEDVSGGAHGFTVHRYSLGDREIVIGIDGRRPHETLDLRVAADDFLRLICGAFDGLMEHAVCRIWKHEASKQRKEWNKRLCRLRENGGALWQCGHDGMEK